MQYLLKHYDNKKKKRDVYADIYIDNDVLRPFKLIQ